MEVTINRLIMCKDNAHNSRTVSKTFNSNIIPHKGDYIISSAFEGEEEVKVASVYIDYERNECMVYLEKLTLNTEDISYLKQTVDMYMLHEWECGFYGFNE